MTTGGGSEECGSAGVDLELYKKINKDLLKCLLLSNKSH